MGASLEPPRSINLNASVTKEAGSHFWRHLKCVVAGEKATIEIIKLHGQLSSEMIVVKSNSSCQEMLFT